jgi:5-methylcytosine-specific restriction endonuclease McrA
VVEEVQVPDIRLKIDPGSRTTGMAIVNQGSGQVVFAAEIEHRGEAIKQALDARRAIRRSRRSRKTRYRKPRFLNRMRPEGWLPPSLKSRISNIETWVNRLALFYPISGISMELVKFDTQLLENPKICGIEYQQGELAGYEVREYLLCKWGGRCAYCSKTDIPLQIEHIIPESRGGSDRVSNLTLACEDCNQRKGTKTAAEFGFAEIEQQAKEPLKDAAALNATRWILIDRLKGFGLPVETGSGGLTKYNRTERDLPKAHWIDAACVGKSTPAQNIVDGLFHWRSRRQGITLARCAEWTSTDFRAHQLKAHGVSKASELEIWSGRPSHLGKRSAPMKGEWQCVAAAHSM